MHITTFMNNKKKIIFSRSPLKLLDFDRKSRRYLTHWYRNNFVIKKHINMYVCYYVHMYIFKLHILI